MTDKLHDLSSADELLGHVANEFFERMARGEQPRIEEYAARYPDIAADIRRTFPAMSLVRTSLSSSSSPAAPPEFLDCKSLGDFRIVRELGRGGMGIVYEAEQLSMGRRVALKVLPFLALVNEKPLQRFKNEVHAAATLDHPHIVSVFSVGEERGVHYFAMQLVHGQTIASVIDELRKVRVVPEITGVDVEGNPLTLSSHIGKVIVLDFFGDWCPYSREMYALKRRLLEAYKTRPLVILGVNSDPTRDASAVTPRPSRFFL